MKLGSAVLLLALAGAGPAFPRSAGAGPLFLLDAQGKVDTLSHWQALVGEEFELPPDNAVAPFKRRPVGVPVSVNAFLYDGLMIPFTRIAFILPEGGVIGLRDGHEIRVRPLRECSLNRLHNYIDLERQAMVLAADSSRTGHPSLEPRDVELSVSVEFTTMRTIAGFERQEVVMRAITESAAVVLAADAMEAARKALARVARGSS